MNNSTALDEEAGLLVLEQRVSFKTIFYLRSIFEAQFALAIAWLKTK